MELLKRYPILSLVLGNALALSLLVLPLNATGAGGENTFCPPEAEGCACWDGCSPDPEEPCLSPPGCYEDPLWDERDCNKNIECTEPE